MTVLKIVALLLLLGSWCAAESLRSAAHGKVRIGTAAKPGFITEDSRYAATLAREFDQLEPENEMKWAGVGPGGHSSILYQPTNSCVLRNRTGWRSAVTHFYGIRQFQNGLRMDIGRG